MPEEPQAIFYPLDGGGYRRGAILFYIPFGIIVVLFFGIALFGTKLGIVAAAISAPVVAAAVWTFSGNLTKYWIRVKDGRVENSYGVSLEIRKIQTIWLEREPYGSIIMKIDQVDSDKTLPIELYAETVLTALAEVLELTSNQPRITDDARKYLPPESA